MCFLFLFEVIRRLGVVSRVWGDEEIWETLLRLCFMESRLRGDIVVIYAVIYLGGFEGGEVCDEDRRVRGFEVLLRGDYGDR